jgi:hypothetical protein
MYRPKICWIIIGWVILAQAQAQPTVFEPLTLPVPSLQRMASGEPGPNYWQQRVDYRIRATLDTTTHRITGSETITYTNNAPLALQELWLQLDQNLFAAGSLGDALIEPGSRWRGAFEGGGFQITRLEVVQQGRRYTPNYLIDDTRMRIDLEMPLPAQGGQVQLEIDFSFIAPEYGADRMGRLRVAQGTVYEIAQWYPRLYVFDDVNGWNVAPYLGQVEFYLEYGNFDVEITVPRNFIVVATGELLNPAEVLTKEQQARLAQARRSAETVYIIRPEEVGRPETRPTGEGPLTWHFRVENVRDFAWAASQAFIWDAASWQHVLLMSVYPKEGLGTPEQPGCEHSTRYLRHSIAHYSEMWYPYPYPVAINVAGIVGGMEYPMIVFCSVRARGQGLFGVTDHEIGHTWFPMIVGSDERRYAWQDEGLNTFINYYAHQAFYGSASQRSQLMEADYIARLMQDTLLHQPIMTYPDRIRPQALGFVAYRKPGYGMRLLREYVLGPERFDRAFRAYIHRWAFKHPQPADFFRTIENVAGEDLDWFWRGWFYSTDLLDQAIDSVRVAEGQTRLYLHNRQGLVFPVVVEATYADGRKARYRFPVELWATGTRQTVEIPGEAVQVALDPDHLLPDLDRTNNIWPVPTSEQ